MKHQTALKKRQRKARLRTALYITLAFLSGFLTAAVMVILLVPFHKSSKQIKALKSQLKHGRILHARRIHEMQRHTGINKELQLSVRDLQITVDQQSDKIESLQLKLYHAKRQVCSYTDPENGCPWNDHECRNNVG